jgi:acyl-CoA synthetase (AMP-forming)/AMP-acid ligase II
MQSSGAKCIFTCLPLLKTTLKAAHKIGIPRSRIYIIELPKELTGGAINTEFKTVSDLVENGKELPPLDPLQWTKGEGARRTAFLCYSSGTSGLPKGVKISHLNVIANTMQVKAYDEDFRNTLKKPGEERYMENELGLLPFSHIYGLVVILHAGIYRGDCIVVLPNFEFKQLLQAVQDYRINTLYLVPPSIILMSKNKHLLDQFDLSSVKVIFSGAAPLGQETADDLNKQHPNWLIRQGYGTSY